MGFVFHTDTILSKVTDYGLDDWCLTTDPNRAFLCQWVMHGTSPTVMFMAWRLYNLLQYYKKNVQVFLSAPRLSWRGKWQNPE
jgi:hypothetical protein